MSRTAIITALCLSLGILLSASDISYADTIAPKGYRSVPDVFEKTSSLDDNFYFNYRYSKEMNKKVIGKNVQIIRRKNKITQKELAEMFNTSQSTVSAYENGKTLVLTVFIYSLAVKFNLSVDKLCGRTKNKNYIYN